MTQSLENLSIIATRRYFTPSGAELTVQIYAPYRDQSGSFRCWYATTGAVTSSIFAVGLDSVEAIDNVLWLLGTEIARLDKSFFHEQLQWIGSDEDKRIGLPEIATTEPDFKGY